MSLISFSPRVAQAIAEHQPVVALESSVFAQGLPIPTNADAARRMIGAIERVGAVPAISAVSAGKAVFGLSDDELARFLARDGVMKVSARDIPVAMLQGRDGATTVAGALSLMALSPIRVFATGGIGGVHREPQFDESADLAELSRTPGHRRVRWRKVDPRPSRNHGATRVVRRGRRRISDEGDAGILLRGHGHPTSGVRRVSGRDSPAVRASMLARTPAIDRGHAAPPAEHAVRKATIERALDSALDDAKRHGVRGGGSHALSPHRGGTSD